MKTSLLLGGVLAGWLTSHAFAQTNYFAGAYAGYSNSGSYNYNTFVGYASGYFTTTGTHNSFQGALSGYRNTTGTGNSFFGYAAGYLNTTGGSNSFFGYGAGYYNSTGVGNSFFGYAAGNLNTTGGGNNFLGQYTGTSNTTGNFNTFTGGFSGYHNTTGGYNLFEGYSTGYANTTGNYNSLVGYAAGTANTTGSRNAFVGYFAGYHNTTGNANTALGTEAGPSGSNLKNTTALGNRAYVTASNCLVLGSIHGINNASENTNVGIGTTAPSYRLHLGVNSAAKPGSSSWTVASDKRLKQNIQPFEEGLSVVEQIRPVRFEYNGKADMPQREAFVGVIAQEVQAVAPYMVGTFTYQDTTGKEEQYLDYDATALTYLLVNAVKELHRTNTALQTEVETLRQELTELRAAVLSQATPGESAARLWQNRPNPAHQATTIRYQFPVSATSAFLKVFSVTGQELYRQNLLGQPEGEVTLSEGQLAAGTYVYQLIVDGRAVDSKKLVVTR
ncbi:Chaperone of endosialidase [Catalinimonas alkaloidigena]|uniref:Chaperone of endosialidase n=1 Tax=Catalinimonas alkaloidigena TaxID=1075417 RepID=A0A1G9UHB6_9BACT|nr:tail fiber domain-containing protein [Catalinimonas alkaloidigena]SDM59312.1 Chaperone of endosialidase [Catalinimonas alkaloidigena]